jgi:hypothetical protein
MPAALLALAALAAAAAPARAWTLAEPAGAGAASQLCSANATLPAACEACSAP